MDTNTNVAETVGKYFVDELGQYFYRTPDGNQYAVTVASPSGIGNQALQNQKTGEVYIEIKEDQDPVDDKKLFKCDNCDYTAKKKNLLKQHAVKHSEDRPHKCTQCGKSFKTIPSLQVHAEIHKGYKPFQCNECNSSFLLGKELHRHMQYRHIKEKPHKCTTCDYACVELSKLRRHIRTHTGEKPFTCKQCPYASPDTFKLQRHMRVHTGEHPYQCDICEARFTQSNSLKIHKLLHDKHRETFQCKDCPSKFSRLADVRYHVQKQHSSDHPIQCSFCGQLLPDRYSFREHKKIHKGEKPYKCQSCSYAVSTAAVLQKHINSNHAKKVPMACDQCDKFFLSSTQLRSHQKKDHSEIVESLECPVCKKVYKNIGSFEKHMDAHSSDSNYKVTPLLEFPRAVELDFPNDITEYSRINDNDKQSRELNDAVATKFGTKNCFGFDDDMDDDDI